jgi:hypothetical protein
MKKVKTFLTAAAVLVVVGGALAFKGHRQGAFICQTTSSSTCSSGDLNYRQDEVGGSTLFCNDGAGGTSCTNELDHMVQDN